MSKTPRTDELEGKLHDKIGHGSYEMALPFCRQLETELAEALSQRNQTISELATFLEDNRRLETELAEMREALNLIATAQRSQHAFEYMQGIARAILEKTK